MTQVIHPQTELGTVTLIIKNLARSITFYKEVIGFEVLEQSEGHAALTADGKTVLIELEEHPDAIILPPRSTAGLYHYAILLPDRKSLSLALRHLSKRGIRIGQSDHLVSEALYLSDPDGNGIEIYRDRPKSGWEKDQSGNYVMATDPLNIEDLLAEAGEEEWQGLPEGTTIGHIHLHTKDLESAREFYCHLLGFEPVGDYPSFRALFIAAGGYHHHIGLNIWAGIGAPAASAHATGLKVYTIVLPDGQELATRVEILRQAKYEVNEHDGAFFVTDPAGICIKLISR
ncbi:VOC family protein [Jeotgalibacillus soli]|uniref:Catechol-2,3-dioxygenase subunit CatE n=1 Tax=Jeotgalibacillus soli TaxID=889306 RepID=A0A0C2S5Y0_9BACL|nr:VOC family protein [Jeotgalibacillus soli]KIL49449.1 catechol-2,3-dioxygenase subunit CatE [Jeotgalibacillus soli]